VNCSVLFLAVDLGSLVGRQVVRALAASAVGIQTTLHHYFLMFDRPAAGVREHVPAPARVFESETSELSESTLWAPSSVLSSEL
jgi:hypothetical protein